VEAAHRILQPAASPNLITSQSVFAYYKPYANEIEELTHNINSKAAKELSSPIAEHNFIII